VNEVRERLGRLLPLLAALAALAAGCDLPGRPTPADRPVPADQVTDFGALYTTRCAGCHGADGKLGPAPPLNDPIFLAIVPDAELLRVITEGQVVTPAQKTPMPAFARDRGGPLTGAQVKVLADGIKERWGQQPESDAAAPPPYRDEKTRGNPKAGKKVFAAYCACCHGKDGEGGDVAGPVHDRAFLELISDQALRRLVITGRPDLGMPDYRTQADRPSPFHPMSPQDVADVAALLADWRQGGSTDDE
jgi:cytochrome c oxidase cbb3-type subunit 3